MTWLPENNRIAWGPMTPEEQAAMEAAKHGWEWWHSPDWLVTTSPVWRPHVVYRALPAPVAKPPVDPAIWRFLPLWVMYLAMDADKTWWGYEFEPEMFDDDWNSRGDVCATDQFVLPTDGFDWRDSLIMRPEGM